MPRKAKPSQSNNEDDKPKKKKGKGDKKSKEPKKKAPQRRRQWKNYSNMLKSLSEEDLRFHLRAWLSSLFRRTRRE